jgi:catechol 2,3-dioxygenase-like lactoylglutathione lyase family enzyme
VCSSAIAGRWTTIVAETFACALVSDLAEPSSNPLDEVSDRRAADRSLSLAHKPEQAHPRSSILEGGTPMPRIKHIALTTKDPAKVAAFYRDAFGMQEIRRAPNGAVFLTDGYINLAILNWKTENSADVGTNGPHYSGIHHFGFEVEDLDEAAKKLEHAQGQRLEEKEGLDMMAAGGHHNFEMKWAGPDGVVIDISHTGWETTPR